jgi:hypothetical protein
MAVLTAPELRARVEGMASGGSERCGLIATDADSGSSKRWWTRRGRAPVAARLGSRVRERHSIGALVGRTARFGRRWRKPEPGARRLGTTLGEDGDSRRSSSQMAVRSEARRGRQLASHAVGTGRRGGTKDGARTAQWRTQHVVEGSGGGQSFAGVTVIHNAKQQ